MHAGLKQMTKTGQYFGGTAQCLLPKCHLDKSHVELLLLQKQICLTVFSAMSHSMPEASDKWYWKGLGPVQNAWNPLGLKTLLGYHTSLCCWKCLTSLQKPVFPLWQQRQNLKCAWLVGWGLLPDALDRVNTPTLDPLTFEHTDTVLVHWYVCGNAHTPEYHKKCNFAEDRRGCICTWQRMYS